MELGTVHLSQACSSHRLIVELLEELTGQCLEVFKEQLIHLARMTLESLPGLQWQAAPFPPPHHWAHLPEAPSKSFVLQHT